MLQETLDLKEDVLNSSDGLPKVSFAPESLQRMHSMAYVYYKNQCYREADALFRILVQADPLNGKYWKGLGACLQMKRNYQAALKCYGQVRKLLENKADAYLDIHCADCYFALDQITNGLKALNSARLKALKNSDKIVLNHVAFMRSRWKSKVV
jgi:tetratricopeptide (TPR) repeat protein